MTAFFPGGVQILKRAIVLAGGGAKGSYQFGFWRAIREMGLEFHIVTGSSVGALNGAMMASGLFERGIEMWNSIRTEDIITSSPTAISQVIDTDGIASSLRSFLGDMGENAVKLEMDPFPLGNLIDGYLDEKALRESETDFGIMISEYPNMRSHPVRLSEIPYGMLKDYLMASSTVYPSMRPAVIAGKKYVDGGYSDNFPVNLALDMGADDIIGVNLNAAGIEAEYKTDLPVRIIRPGFDLGPTMEFIPEIAKRNLALGYNDTMRSFGLFDGMKYTLKSGESAKMQKEFAPFCAEMLLGCGAIGPSEKSDFHRSLAVKGLCEKQKRRLGLMRDELAVLSAETAAEIFSADPTKIYSADEFSAEILLSAKEFLEKTENPAGEIFSGAKPLNYKLTQLSSVDKRDLTAFMTELWKPVISGKEPGRELRTLCRFAPAEFFASLYISFLKNKGE